MGLHRTSAGGVGVLATPRLTGTSQEDVLM